MTIKIKIEITCKDERREEPWTEEYDIDSNLNPETWALELIERFNASLRSGETKRTVISVRKLGAGTDHSWVKRTGGMSVQFRGQMVDLMFCSVCGVTGKRSGLNPRVKLDSKYSKVKYKICTRGGHHE